MKFILWTLVWVSLCEMESWLVILKGGVAGFREYRDHIVPRDVRGAAALINVIVWFSVYYGVIR